MSFPLELGRRDALLLIDLQNDFLPGGALPVSESVPVVEAANAWLDRFRSHRLPVFASRDWHPPDHCSFLSHGGPWPVHCVAGTPGATFPPGLRWPDGTIFLDKAYARDREAYSVFDGTDLDCRLKNAGVDRLFIGGIATDYCVLHTVIQALALGYGVFVLTDAIAALNMRPGDGAAALKRMCEAGAVPIAIADVGA